ncbi:MAG: ROK family glucokinase [Lachnospiraceae bacterium]|nr:ROK family glucokinase [Lachnospiraceae bacterium]
MSRKCFGVDIGGTTVKLGCFEADGKLVDKWEIPTRKENGGENILPDVVKAIEAKLEELSVSKGELIGIGIGVPGPVFEDGTVNACVNLGWGVFNVGDKVREIIGLPELDVKIGNDANVAALGEMFKGSGEGFKNLVMVTLGTGVGGGVILDGKILTGTTGGAGEIGHMPVGIDEEEACSCGKKGCLEQYASATGIVKVAKRILASCDTETPLRAMGGFSAKDVVDLAKENDKVAVSVMETLGEYLGKALASIACIVNPKAFVIGGGVSKAGQYLIDVIEKHFKEHAFGPCSDVKFVIASLGNDAGIYGASALVLS